MIPARILGTGSYLTGRRISTRELCERAVPDRDPELMQQRIGISNRYWVEPGVTAAETATEALSRALQRAGIEASDLSRIIFVSSTGGDSLIPGTAHHVCQRLGLDDTCDAFDINNSCAGFLTGLDTAARAVATGMGPVGVVAGEIFSRYLPVEKPRPYLVMGDAAGAAVIAPGEGRARLLASHLRSALDMRLEVTMAHPGLLEHTEHKTSNGDTFLRFDASYKALTDSALHALEESSRAVLESAGMSLDDVAWFLPHQPNGRMLDIILERMGVSPERTEAVVDEIGSVGAASIPVSLDQLMRNGRVRAGDHILMTAVGAGTGYGALLFQVGP